jgi:uncharacterized membrane protein YqjE
MTQEASTTDLVRQAAEQVSTLVRDEIKLAQAELAEKGRQAARGAGMFGGAAAFAVYGVGALVFTLGLALALVWPAWLAALTTAVVLFLAAGGLALIGRNYFRRVPPLAPQRTVKSVQADVDTVTAAVSHAVEERTQS